MKSFIGWIGGKSHLKNQIISLIPNNCTRYNLIVEQNGHRKMNKK